MKTFSTNTCIKCGNLLTDQRNLWPGCRQSEKTRTCEKPVRQQSETTTRNNNSTIYI